MPLKLVFKNVDSSANSFYTIYKIGDDLRQDMFVLQLINVMNQLWLMEGNSFFFLNLKSGPCLYQR
jgi:phosphatidylinositol kinase/protein kinase (PI-3  family)